MRAHDRLYIGGEWVASTGDGSIPVVNPATEEVIATVPAGTAEDVDRAVRAARRPSRRGRRRPWRSARRLLWRAARGLARAPGRARRHDHRRDGRPGQGRRPVQTGLPLQVARLLRRPRAAPPSRPRTVGNSLVVREPVGVVGAITPWNYPLHQIVAKVAPALAAGCTVVLKPSEVAPLSALRPRRGRRRGRTAGRRVQPRLRDRRRSSARRWPRTPTSTWCPSPARPAPDGGCSEVAAATVKRVALELGGKSANVILADADLAAAVKVGVANCFLNSGQTCTAWTRMLVPAARYDEVVRWPPTSPPEYTRRRPDRPGHPARARWPPRPSATACAATSTRALPRVHGSSPAAPTATGSPDRGYYVAPTVFADVDPRPTIAQEEIFGPVLSIIRYADEDEAVRIANDTQYGLAGGVWSADPDRAMAVARRLRTGQVDINGGRFNPLRPVRRVQAVRHRPRARAARAGGVPARQVAPAAVTVEAAVLREVGAPLHVEEISLGEPGPGQVRVRMVATGVCHSDLSLARGTLAQPVPAVLGHEGAGRVVSVGDGVTGLSPGDAVLLNWAPPCRQCWWCEHGEPYLCAHAGDAAARPYAELADGTPLYGALGVAAFATETVVAQAACIPVPGDIDLADAALLGCAVLTGVGAVVHAARVQPGDSVAVIGLGGVGLCAVQGARIAGAELVIAVDGAPEKADLARRLGATHVLEPGDDLGKRIRALTDGRGVDHAIECVGRAQTIRTAWSVTRRGGQATIIGLGARDDTMAFNALEVAHFARDLRGSMYGNSDPAVDIPLLLEHVRAGRLDLDALVSRRIALADVELAFGEMVAGRGARTLIVFEGGST